MTVAVEARTAPLPRPHRIWQPLLQHFSPGLASKDARPPPIPTSTC